MSDVLKMVLDYGIVFVVGGALCAIAQILIVKTKITPARILVIFLLAGILLETIGVYKYMYDFAKAGVSTPILGFGASLAKGAIELAQRVGFLGAFAGGLIRTAYGIGAAVVASYFVTLIFSPKSK